MLGRTLGMVVVGRGVVNGSVVGVVSSIVRLQAASDNASTADSKSAIHFFMVNLLKFCGSKVVFLEQKHLAMKKHPNFSNKSKIAIDIFKDILYNEQKM